MRSGPIVWMTSKPSSFGMWTSRKTRSGDWDRIASTVSTPSRASPTISMSCSAPRSDRIRSRASGSSSAISARIVRGGAAGDGDEEADGIGEDIDMLGSPCASRDMGRRDDRLLAEWNRYEHGEIFAVPLEFESESRAEPGRESGACVGDADTGGERRHRAFARAGSGIADGHHEHVAFPPGRDRNPTGPAVRRNAVLDGVLDERLKNQGRNHRVEHVV